MADVRSCRLLDDPAGIIQLQNNPVRPIDVDGVDVDGGSITVPEARRLSAGVENHRIWLAQRTITSHQSRRRCSMLDEKATPG